MHQTNVTRIKYYIDKRWKKMGGSKNVKKPNGKKRVVCNTSKEQSSKSG
jgi:hypothetical protein